jgi:hypothetical protein
VPTRARRFALFIGALSATLTLGGAGAGIASAGPDDSGNSPETGSGTGAGDTSEPAPTVAKPVQPKSPLDNLRDALSRPRTTLGSGRAPGQPPKPVVTIPLPKLPGTSDTQFSINLSDPESTFSTVQDTLASLNQLVADAYAPYNPFPPPPGPNMKIMEEEPVIDSSGVPGIGGGGVQSTSGGMADLPVLHAPMAFPAPRFGTSGPLAETVPAGASAQAPGAGTAGTAGTPAGRGSTPGSVRTGEASPGDTTSPMVNTAYRQSFPQYLRAARTAEVASIALPGVAGLLAITASGGVIGYRQANSGRKLRSDATRFLR